MIIPESELILNPDGSIYHIHLRPEHVAPIVITVGDPNRVERISKHFDKIEFDIRYREFITHTGMLGNQRITVIGTGIGTDNIDIVMNELDALVNVDLKTREIKEQHTSLDIIRIGTTGGLSSDVEVDGFVFSEFGLGLDGLLNFYEAERSSEEKHLEDSFREHFGYPELPPAYVFKCSEELIDKFADGHPRGITATCTGFYGPQGRILRAKALAPDFLDLLGSFRFENFSVTNFEMETAAMYGLSKILGHRCLSCNAILANRVKNTFSKDPKKVVDRLITHVLERLVSSN